ncbi:UxpB protein [Litchfieldella anticariensis FP35 = DSM 16096]|uniref:UxpB protein n=1 Tax=Litchfieldella anticariensis (strain DSM 16096 / CECT 5854 / CIP 108499 / LMG 22089 / FP35) TaxID=1121939 RepID=S2KNN7_LITA3|nr:PhoX family phosphatase [Halomonas anticariensis]EPC02088.1 UxpB protein [Halomonas anticariensis FP35 = DSM 16096]
MTQPQQPGTTDPILAAGDEPLSNHSDNRYFGDVLQARLSRRGFLRGSLATAVTAAMATSLPLASAFAGQTQRGTGPTLGFTPIPTSTADTVVVPQGYRSQILIPWGTPITGDYPEFAPDNDGEAQAQQTGSHHDGMHFFAIDGSSQDGLLVLNHEYVEPRFMHAAASGLTLDSEGFPQNEDGSRDPDQVLREMNGHGVSVIRIRQSESGQWGVVRDDFNRRITARTPMMLSGPVAGTEHVRTKYSPDGTMTRGTQNNCSSGVTPWNTYMAAEENWSGYFANEDTEIDRRQSRYGIETRDTGRWNWHRAAGGDDEFIRFDATSRGASAEDDYRNEPNTFGYMVEIDPFDPDSTPVKRTHLGRFAHEGVIFAPAVEGKPVVCYSGDDSRFEYIYKFVSAQPYHAASADGSLLDEGTLYVARFNDDGSGEWLALAPGKNGLTPENGFADLADILVNTRSAADHVGATKMDRPEWGAVDPENGYVYFTLTNNSKREEDQLDAANPRAANGFGQIVRWQEDGSQEAERFQWELFVLAGDGEDSRDLAGNPLGEEALLACPDGLCIDADRRVWIQTDISDSSVNDGIYTPFGNNQMLAANPETGEIKRFLTGPIGQEITGMAITPDQRTMFINVQHPGANTSAEDFAQGRYLSHWPEGGDTFPRSATVVITREDGGVIGT